MQRWVRHPIRLAVLGYLAVGLIACGSDGINTPTSPTPPPPPPPSAAQISATAAGRLVVHPSANPKFAIALETPLKIQETGGGTALWAYARFSLLKNGKEIERNDFGVTDLRNLGAADIDAHSSHTYDLIFRFNSSDFDQLAVTLGFQDKALGNKITIDVPPDSFPGVDVNFTPMLAPSNTVVRID